MWTNPETILHQPFPVQELLNGCLYYPSAGLDGNVVRLFSKHVQSFVFVDYAQGKEALMAEIANFSGYEILAERAMRMEELIPNGWMPQTPPGVNAQSYLRYKEQFKQPFGRWAVYKRKDRYSEFHGPEYFSLLYLGGEGVASYQALFQSNNLRPSILAIIQPGHAFGNGWTGYHYTDEAMYWVANQNPAGLPETILYGGYGDEYDDLEWDGYQMKEKIEPYYQPKGNGCLRVWQRS